MYIASLPFFPTQKKIYDINQIRPTEDIMMQLYPEIYSCIGCNACTKACPQGLNVMQYIAYAQRGEYAACAEASFDCVACGMCSSRCPARISHPHGVAACPPSLTASISHPKSEHLAKRVQGDKGRSCSPMLVNEIADKPLDGASRICTTTETSRNREEKQMLTQEMLDSIKRVEASRPQRIGAELKRMSAQEKDALLPVSSGLPSGRLCLSCRRPQQGR